MKISALVLSLGLSFGIVSVAVADATNVNSAVTAAQKKLVTQAVDKLSKSIDKKLPISSIDTTPIPGLFQVTSGVSVFYITADGKYVMIGEILDPSKNKNDWSLTENVARQLRKHAISQVNPKDMIIFPATGNKIGTATVFTDIDCAYCRKMQQHIDDYNSKGIEIRYLAFPRSGPKTASFDEAVTVWCSKDRNDAYTKAVEGTKLSKLTCKNPVKMEYDLAMELGVNGTPTIFLDNGIKLGGLVDPKSLEKIIKGEDLSDTKR